MDKDRYLGIVLAGWVMAFVLPIGGLVTAMLLAERRTGHAVGMGAVSLAWLLGAWWLYVTTR